MAIYTLQEASLELPDVFKDRTMNLFTLSENNASEFTFVVSRASALHDDTVQKVAARVIQEMSTTVQAFNSVTSQLIVVDGLPAVEAFYHFENGGVQIWQKQTILLLDDEPGGKKIVCYIGTCPGHFSEYYQKQYRAIIDSIKFNSQNSEAGSAPVASDSSDIFFSLDNDTKILTAHEGVNALYQHVDLKRALNGSYLFYDKAGNPLHIAALNNEEPLRYALWTSVGKNLSSLTQMIGIAKAIEGPEELSGEKQILAFLQRHRDE
ncbi:DcrB-related protein [Pantoea dispersa]|uniref:DcrB-related protein n=1 Tax=Pantoea dispersa TaxID=59814 RepID=UPI002DB77E1B|nr:DcrB-related protein [Pantoea dispersa]MEB5972960.1 DcrB-related protein [Pantoea dispersa]